jgi:hypothetical protein
MPSYTFQVGNGGAVCIEAADIVLSDHDAAREFAIGFAAMIFRLHPELCAGEWERCAVHVLDDEEEVFAATIPQAALIERDDLRQQHMTAADN